MEQDETDVLALIDSTNLLRPRSSLQAWMRKHHDAFQQRMGGRIADWTVLADFFGKAGLTDRLGKSPKPETARKMWQRVRKEIGAERASKLPTQSPAEHQPAVQVEMIEADTPKPSRPRRNFPMSSPPKKEI